LRLDGAWLPEYHPEVIIETGTGGGGSLGFMVQQPVSMIHSIELDYDTYQQGLARFSRFTNVSLWWGDSRDVLTRLINPWVSTLFWLDAHWSGGEYTQNYPEVECPLLDELDIIISTPWKAPVIVLIDDYRMFSPDRTAMPKYDLSQWPTFEDILDRFRGWWEVRADEVHDVIRARRTDGRA
jgi:hypothetical protein